MSVVSSTVAVLLSENNNLMEHLPLQSEPIATSMERKKPFWVTTSPLFPEFILIESIVSGVQHTVAMLPIISLSRDAVQANAEQIVELLNAPFEKEDLE